MNYLEATRHFIVENFMFGDGAHLEDNTSFLEAGIIDSTGILELIMFIEETYGIKIKDDELVPENLDNLKNISEFIAKKMDSKPIKSA